MAPEPPARPRRLGPRTVVVLAVAIAATWSYFQLDLTLSGLVPGEAGLDRAVSFFSHALSPAWDSEAAFVPEGTASVLELAIRAVGTTVAFAASAMSLALVFGLCFGFFASTAWWAGDPAGADSPLFKFLRRSVLPALYVCSRVFITTVRSIHELFWALIFILVVGHSDLAAVLAIALPYSGYLAKIFSEMVDETPRRPSHALRALGAGAVSTFFFGYVARALTDMIAYSFYRFECALRSSAVLGFFGFPTIGLHIRLSFLAGNDGEVWTFLYVLIVVIVLFDWWSGAVRRRLVA